MRYIFWLVAIGLVIVLVRIRWQSWRRYRRGETPQKRNGPRDVTLLCGALILVYGVWLGYRLLVGA